MARDSWQVPAVAWAEVSCLFIFTLIKRTSCSASPLSGRVQPFPEKGTRKDPGKMS